MSWNGWFCIADIVTKDGGRWPRLPTCSYARLLAEPGENCTFALWETDADYDEMEQMGVELVGEALFRLLDSGMRYPPAIALAREAVRIACKERHVDRVEFPRLYERIMREALESQREDGFALAEVVESDDFDIEQGRFYWMRQEEGATEVLVVSGRYELTRCPAAWLREAT